MQNRWANVPNHDPTSNAKCHDAKNNSNQANVHSHIAVCDVTVFVRNDALKFIST